MTLAPSVAPYYPLIKQLHITLVVLSVMLFTARGLGVLGGAAWPQHRGLRGLSVVIDSALLAAGATLWALAALNPLRDSWLGVKLVLVLAYIVMGALALKRARTRAGRALSFVVALLLVAAAAGIAREHSPAGFAHFLLPGWRH